MDLKIAEGKASPKREFRFLNGRHQRTSRSNLFEAIAQVSDGGVVSQSNEDGVVRIKIVVRMQDLKQVLEAMRGGKNSTHRPSYSTSSSPSSSSVEQRLILLRRKHLLREGESRRRSWSPVLQSIPEEI